MCRTLFAYFKTDKSYYYSAERTVCTFDSLFKTQQDRIITFNDVLQKFPQCQRLLTVKPILMNSQCVEFDLLSMKIIDLTYDVTYFRSIIINSPVKIQIPLVFLSKIYDLNSIKQNKLIKLRF